jgi:HEAT repeat protein
MCKLILTCLTAIALTACGCTHPPLEKIPKPRHSSPRIAVPKEPLKELKARIEQLLEQMADDDYRKREKAQSELQRLLQTKADIVLPYLLRAYESTSDPEVKTRLEAVPIIQRHIEFGVTAALLVEFPDVLTQAISPKAQTRRAIVEKLGNAKKSDAEVILLKALKDRNKQVYLSAIKALGSIGSTKAVEPLLDKVRSAPTETRIALVEALGEIGDPRAIEPLVSLFGYAANPAKEAAALALCKLSGEKALEAAIGVLRDTDGMEIVRTAVAKGLASRGDRRAVEPLLEVFMEPCGDILTWAVGEALEEFADPKSVETCIQALKKINTMKYDEAIDILASIGKPAVKALVEALKKEDWRIRDGATKALVKIGKPAVKPLVKSLESSNPDIRYATVRALGEIKDERGVGPLVKALRDKEYSVAQAAAEALKKITKRDFGKDYEKWKKWYEENKEK